MENVDTAFDSDRLDVADVEEDDPNDYMGQDDMQGVVPLESDSIEDVEEVRTATATAPTTIHLVGDGQNAEYKDKVDGPARNATGRGRGAQTKQAKQLQVKVEGRGRGRGRGRLTRN